MSSRLRPRTVEEERLRSLPLLGGPAPPLTFRVGVRMLCQRLYYMYSICIPLSRCLSVTSLPSLSWLPLPLPSALPSLLLSLPPMLRPCGSARSIWASDSCVSCLTSSADAQPSRWMPSPSRRSATLPFSPLDSLPTPSFTRLDPHATRLASVSCSPPLSPPASEATSAQAQGGLSVRCWSSAKDSTLFWSRPTCLLASTTAQLPRRSTFSRTPFTPTSCSGVSECIKLLSSVTSTRH